MRKKFPLLKKHKNIVYLDSAATTQKPDEVIQAFTDYYENNNANSHRGLYKLSENATHILREARQEISFFIGAEQEEVIFTKSATEGFNALAQSLEVGRWNNIVVTEMEHHSNFLPWQQLAKKTKAEFIVAKSNNNLSDIAKYVNSKTAIVAFTGMSNVTGLQPNAKKIIKEIRAKNPKTIIILDATQLVAHKRLNVKTLDADFVCFSAHKLYGPTGVGILYGKLNLLKEIKPFLYGGNMINQVKEKDSTWAEVPEKFEAGTIDTAGIHAFAQAIKFLEKNDFDALLHFEDELKDYALKELKKLEHVTIIGHENKNYGAVISIKILDLHPHDLAEICSREDICIRAGHHCAQPLMKALNLVATARISLSFYNTKKDIDKFVKTIKKARKIING